MKITTYTINKGVNRPIEFKGLKGQYIWYLGIGLVMLLIFFAVLYLFGVNTYLAVGLIFVTGSALITGIYRMSNRFGEYGMMKLLAKRLMPHVLKCKTRSTFFYGKVFK